MEDNWIKVANIYKNNNINNTVSNIVINYNLHKFKTSNEKSVKDYHFAKVYKLVDRFVIWIVKKENMGLVEEDLHSAGYIGVLKAIEWDFDPLVSDFTTYAYMRIRKEIQIAKSLDNSMHTMPSIHNYYYTTYKKFYKEITNTDECQLDENVIEASYEKLSKSNAWVTKNLLRDIVNNKINKHVYLESSVKSSGDDSSTMSVIDSIESEIWVNDLNRKIDGSILRNKLKMFLWNYTDFEKAIIERKFGIDLGWENTYPVYTIKVTRDWVVWEKEMIAIKSWEAIRRVESLWYKVLSSKDEINKTLRTETYVGSSMRKLRDYFEIQKLTQTTESALRKNEKQIVSQLTTYLTNIYKAKWVENPTVNVSM